MPPAPGMMPMRVSGRQTMAEVVKTRRVQARASSKPPPKAKPEIAAIEGMGREESMLNVWRRAVRKSCILGW